MPVIRRNTERPSDRGKLQRTKERAVADRRLGLARKLGNPVIEGLYKDEGYFAPMSALKRIKISSHTYDLGEYLRDLHRDGKLNTDFGPVSARMAYYPPCHLREQMIGEPYADLLSLVPGISMERIDGAFYCCGISGIMGFKRDFHEVSVEMGSRLMKKIRTIDPEQASQRLPELPDSVQPAAPLQGVSPDRNPQRVLWQPWNLTCPVKRRLFAWSGQSYQGKQKMPDRCYAIHDGHNPKERREHD